MTIKEHMKKYHPEKLSYQLLPCNCAEYQHILNRYCEKTDCDDCWNQKYIPKEEDMEIKKVIIDIPENTSYVNAVHVENGVVVDCKTIKKDEWTPYGIEIIYNDGRIKGQYDAWNFAYKIMETMTKAERCECFGYELIYQILSDMSYDEAKEKYEYYMNRQIKVGDEITDGKETGYVLWIDDKECMAKLGSYDCPQSLNHNKRNFRKTGRHNPKLAEVMREISET